MYVSVTHLNFFSECGKCARGWRVSKNQTHSICEECSEQPKLYDRFFLIFHVVLVLVLHWMAIDLTAKKRCLTQAVLTLHVCASGEVALAASVTLLLTEPIGTFYLHSCSKYHFDVISSIFLSTFQKNSDFENDIWQWEWKFQSLSLEKSRSF